MRKSALYFGSVIHWRVKPIAHRLRTRIFWMLLDLDEIEALANSCWLFKKNKIGALSFFENDHGDPNGARLRDQVAGWLAAENIQARGSIRLLTMPRIFNFVFNPLSVYFCYGAQGELCAIIYEVHNTFGERRRYVTRTLSGSSRSQQECLKDFYVSPFLPPDLRYRFRVKGPNDRVQIAIHCMKAQDVVMGAALAGKRRPFTDAALAAALLQFPMMTFKVWVEIHWNALLLYLKGLPIFPHSPAPGAHP